MKNWNWEEIPCLAVNGIPQKTVDFLKILYNTLITKYSSEQMKIAIISSLSDFVIDEKYLYTKPVTDQNAIADLLIKLNQEILYRYQTFSSAGVKNIKEYNAVKIKMPYIFVFIDDLINLSDSIDKISFSKARAAGIYTIGCTENYSDLPMTVRSNFFKENI